MQVSDQTYKFSQSSEKRLSIETVVHHDLPVNRLHFSSSPQSGGVQKVKEVKISRSITGRPVRQRGGAAFISELSKNNNDFRIYMQSMQARRK